MNQTQMIAQADYLDYAGSMLERHDLRDISSPGLLELTGVSQHGMASASGLNDYDYENLSKLSLGHKQLEQVTTVNKIPIPSEILEHFKHIKCHCMMGLFPEIGRAWLTIDSEIYIWTYEQARDVAYYDGLNHLIVSVGLVCPKAGVFIGDVKYLLVLATSTEIIVLGVTFGDSTKTISSPSRNMQSVATYEEMQLMNKPIFILSTDNITINVIQGSNNGRTFLGGRDGCLYEIYYQAESSWFGKRCKKINHSQGIVSYMVPSFLKVFSETDPIVKIAIDNSRQLLYVLTEKGAIEAWDMGEDCNSMRRVARLSQNEIAYASSNIIKTVDPSVFKTIKSICPLTADDCQNLHLLAVTQCGVRLFFSTTSLIQSHYQQQQQQILQHQQQQIQHQQQQQQMPPSFAEQNKPQGLYLLHVRLPPGYTPNTTINKPKHVHSAHYNEGTLLLVSTPQQDQDILWSVSSAPFPNRQFLTESTTVLPLDGIVWSLAEVKDRCKTKLTSILRNAQKPKKVVLLTNQGAHIIALLKPTDILQQLLIACHGPHHEAVKAFFQVLTEREACATSLLLACSEFYRGTDLAMWAAQAFMLYGGEPGIQHQMMMGGQSGQRGGQHMMQSQMAGASDRNTPQMFMSTPMTMRGVQQQASMQQSQYPLSPISSQTTLYGTSMQPAMNDMASIIYSAKHDGLYIYVARLIRPIWKKRCVDSNLCSTLTQEDCTLILEDLYAIKAFLEANSVNELSCINRPYSAQSTMTNGFGHLLQNTNMNDQRNANEQAQAEEKRSLTALNYFIKHTCEVIALWKILCEHQFQILVNQLTKEQQSILASCTFRDLTLSRADSCALLIVALINSYLRDNASVSSVSTKLRDVCPNLYRHEDAVSFKATEILMMSKNCNIPDEKDEKLRTALQLCKDAAPNLPLPNICQQFTLAGFHEGVIELAATCAAKIDPEEFGIHFYNSDEPAEDREGYAAYAARMNCYKEVRLMLDHVYQTICNTSANQEFARTVCPPDEQNPNLAIMRIVAIVVQIVDPLLHVCIYEWLMAHDMLSELLALAEPTLGEFLRRAVVRNPENLKLIDLLWKYYEKNGHHSQAARILDNLATTPSENIPLVQRIEYLARAVMCMRNDGVGYSTVNGILLKDLEDKLEIARVQKVVLDAVSALAIDNNPNARKAVGDLNYTLYDITQLYQNFADPFDLWECKLTILNCSHHNDPLLIESVWGQILNNAVEGSGSQQEKSTRLISKVQSLVKEFGESGHCFPLAFLVRELEIKACQLRLSEGAIPEALVSMELDVELLMDYYARMISMNERVWANEGNEWHLVQSSIKVVNLLANSANTIPTRSKRRIVAKAQDIVSACLNLCYPKPGTDRLQQALKELQSRLQRIN
ncbi:nuclear pore complex protein Nup154 [Eupeodes corollae]|uniref:nuclear pore complex protein Nup154 n=1 Tax=Eupeodes corollae TaxID=290404 RepID=UPI002490D3DA|nr:nuclear pore complex protein Nup154 [Eupeodes corollae]